MDTYGLEQVEEEFEDNTPTFEEVKKIVDNKRKEGMKEGTKEKIIKRTPSKSYTREDRIKNLQLAREKKKIDKEKVIQKTDIPIIEPLKRIDSSNNFDDLLNEFKSVVALQSEYFEKLKTDININKYDKKIEKKRTPRQKKPKEPIRTLDITIDDNEIKNIIENNTITNTKKNEPIEDPKLKTFLDALKKN